jgi:hypothetical protein
VKIAHIIASEENQIVARTFDTEYYLQIGEALQVAGRVYSQEKQARESRIQNKRERFALQEKK